MKDKSVTEKQKSTLAAIRWGGEYPRTRRETQAIIARHFRPKSKRGLAERERKRRVRKSPSIGRE